MKTIEEGHTSVANNAQATFQAALTYVFLHRRLGGWLTQHSTAKSLINKSKLISLLLQLKPNPVPISRPCYIRPPVQPPPSCCTVRSTSIPLAHPCPTRSGRPSGWSSETKTSKSSYCAAPDEPFPAIGKAMLTDGQWDPIKEVAMVTARETGST